MREVYIISIAMIVQDILGFENLQASFSKVEDIVPLAEKLVTKFHKGGNL